MIVALLIRVNWDTGKLSTRDFSNWNTLRAYLVELTENREVKRKINKSSIPGLIDIVDSLDDINTTYLLEIFSDQ